MKCYKHLKGEPPERNEKISASYKREAVASTTRACSKAGML